MNDLHIHVPSMSEIMEFAHAGRERFKLPMIAGGAPLAVDAVFYENGIEAINAGDIDWTDASTYITCALANTTYAPNKETDEWYSALGAGTPPANEVANGNGYTTGGISLGTGGTNRTIDTATARTVKLKSSVNPQWTSSTFNFRYAVVFKRVGGDFSTPGDDPLMFYVDCNHIAAANLTVSSGTLTITWHADGCAKYTLNDFQT